MKNTVKITESAVRRYDKKIKLTDLIHERERSRALGAIFSKDKRHQKRNRSFCHNLLEFKLIVIYRGRFHTQESLLSKFLFIEFSLTFKKKSCIRCIMVHVHHKKNIISGP